MLGVSAAVGTGNAQQVVGLRLNRRGLFRVGTGFIAALAALTTEKTVWAGNCGTPCCQLAYCNECTPNGGCNGGWQCPSGYQDSYWTCTSGSWHCTCGECTKTSSCWTGPFGGCSVAYCYQG